MAQRKRTARRDRPMNLADIAARAGVARATVSKVLNHYPGISEHTRRRVLDAVKLLGVTPRRYRRAPGDANRTVCLLPMTQSLFRELSSDPSRIAARAYHAFQQTLTEQGFDLLLGPADLEDDQAVRYIRSNLGSRFAGVALLPPINPPLAEFLNHRRVPNVCLSGSVNDPGVAVVTADHSQGSRLLVRHLLELGHRRIGFIGSGMPSRSFAERLQGFLLEMKLAGRACPDKWIMQPPIADRLLLPDRLVERWHESMAGFLDSLIGRQDMPTAFLCVMDDFARKLIDLLSLRGLAVPEDVSVAGFGGETDLPLTTIDACAMRIGHQGASWLISQIAARDSQPGRMLVPVRLIVGTTTAGPRAQDKILAPPAAKARPSATEE